MPYKNILVFANIVLICMGCASTPMTSKTATVAKHETVQVLEGAPLPSGAVVDNKKSMIFGEGSLWIGRVEVNTALNSEEVISFFINQYPTAGWSFLSSSKSQTSVLIFVGKNKTLTAEIQNKSFGSGSKIILTVSPASQN
jgi:hypothetical protein